MNWRGGMFSVILFRLVAGSASIVGAALLLIGVFVGSGTGFRQRPGGGMAYMHVCKYLYFSGVRRAVSPAVIYASQAEANEQFCLPLDIGHPLDLGAARFYENPFEAIARARD
jgi:hypothetical protein